ncbi:tyrosine-type recombinase/integrase [Cellulosilyticum lentocellum]|uniref:Integrase family protein n=1 Tax=Cellulosilyticum lentocellum (strain ATCC 49066 / DSM 5427 / NCIMB 11756 / RHM5) TaxID=642492 RepID=F2JPG5_CELLD|nr:site-specific integrase [Cellulosilyticum lentocellum]ADZ82513.1 integrase family protein [Cellulosilyticum lentocellum DSM 5427]
MKQIKNPNGYGSIYNLGGRRRKPWAVKVTTGFEKDNETGKLKQIREYLGYFEKRTDAIAALAKYNENPYDISTKKIKLKDIYERWCNTTDFISLSDSTKKSHALAFNKLENAHNMPFSKLNTNTLQILIDETGSTPTVKLQIKKLLGNLYLYAEKYDIVTKNYSKFIDVGDTSSKIERRIYTHEEIEKLWNNLAENKWIDSILFMLYTGFRVSEMLELKIENIDLENLTMSGGKKTAAGKRTIPIHSKIVDIVKNRYDENYEYLFRTQKGTKMTADSYRVSFYNPIMEQLNLTGSGCHDLRHTFCSKMDSYNINATTLKRIMGHSTKDVTDIYTHKTIDDLKEAVELLEY